MLNLTKNCKNTAIQQNIHINYVFNRISGWFNQKIELILQLYI